MNKSVKALLGLATVSPFIFMAGFLGFFIHLINTAPELGVVEYFENYSTIMNLAGSLFTAYFAVIFVIFIAHAARNRNLEASGMRNTWLIALIILGPWVMPFYWFHHIWRDGVTVRKVGPLGLN